MDRGRSGKITEGRSGMARPWLPPPFTNDATIDRGRSKKITKGRMGSIQLGVYSPKEARKFFRESHMEVFLSFSFPVLTKQLLVSVFLAFSMPLIPFLPFSV
ncbi:LysR family transcriptional regulator [Sesbania bispinosa]|nr:LysR family transcriptional regulator [Sesbania bispinosa]